MSGRLTDLERREGTMSGTVTQRLLTDFLEALGWLWCHWRPMQNRRGIWQVPVEGPLGVGWPDVFAIQPFSGRVLGFEVKRQVGDVVTPDQAWVHGQLMLAGIAVHVVRPADLRDPLEASVVGLLLLGRTSSSETSRTAPVLAPSAAVPPAAHRAPDRERPELPPR